MKELFRDYPIYSQEGAKDDTLALCKFFTPTANWTWYVTEAREEEDDFLFFGLVVNDYGAEWGYFRLADLKSVRLPFGLGIERDIYFTPQTIREIKADC